MAISVKTHKRLWTRARDECAFPGCGQALLVPLENETEGDTVIGKECHIVAQADDGPRGPVTLTPDELTRWQTLIDDRDGYVNLILMCGVHHDVIDGDVAAYSIERLIEIKRDHERQLQAHRSPSESHRDNLQIRYAAIVDEWAARIELDDWNARLSSLASDGFVDREYLDRLEAARWWLLDRVWPRTFPELEAAFQAFRFIAEDIDLVVAYFGTEQQDHVFVDRVYKEVPPNRDANFAFLKARSDYYIDLAADLAVELTRAANLICDRVREYVWPSYRLAEGRASVGIGVDFSLVYRVLVPQYPPDVAGQPYPGLDRFARQRGERDYHFGDGLPPKGGGITGKLPDAD